MAPTSLPSCLAISTTPDSTILPRSCMLTSSQRISGFTSRTNSTTPLSQTSSVTAFLRHNPPHAHPSTAVLLGQYPDVAKKPHGQARRNYNIQKAAGIDPGAYKVMKVRLVDLDVFLTTDVLKLLEECDTTPVPQTSRHRPISYISTTTPNEQTETRGEFCGSRLSVPPGLTKLHAPAGNTCLPSASQIR